MNIIKKYQGDSSAYSLNELYNVGKVYIMDNHLAASWCWAKKIDTTLQYNFFHIDKHYDLLDGATDYNVKEIKKQNFELHNSTIEELIELKHPIKNEFEIGQIFRFDNYITIFDKLYPTILNKMYFATHKDGTVPDNWEFYASPIYELHSNIAYWVNQTEEKWIINIDIDYFFDEKEDSYIQILSDDYINSIADELIKCWERIEVLTIALSPSFCGGDDKSKRIANILCEKLGINLILD